MSSPVFYPEGHSPRPQDTEHVLLEKILGALIDQGAASTNLLNGSGAPTANPGVNFAVYFDNDPNSPTGGLFWVWSGSFWFSTFGA